MKKMFCLFIAMFLSAASFAASSIELNWKVNSTNESGFRVERSTNAGVSWTVVKADLPAKSTTWTDTSVVDGTTYSYRVVAFNSAGSSPYSNVAAAKANSAPTISNITDRTINVNTNTGAIAFTIGDTSEPVGTLALSASSSNLTLVPVANIVFGGTGANRTVTVTPTQNQLGSATITVTVSDGVKTSSDTFVLTVNDVVPNAPSDLSVEVR